MATVLPPVQKRPAPWRKVDVGPVGSGGPLRWVPVTVSANEEMIAHLDATNLKQAKRIGRELRRQLGEEEEEKKSLTSSSSSSSASSSPADRPADPVCPIDFPPTRVWLRFRRNGAPSAAMMNADTPVLDVWRQSEFLGTLWPRYVDDDIMADAIRVFEKLDIPIMCDDGIHDQPYPTRPPKKTREDASPAPEFSPSVFYGEY
jgi:hypothetical protein